MPVCGPSFQKGSEASTESNLDEKPLPGLHCCSQRTVPRPQDQDILFQRLFLEEPTFSEVPAEGEELTEKEKPVRARPTPILRPHPLSWRPCPSAEAPLLSF